MLSIGRLSGPDSERYYLDKVARGREDYYAGRGEMPGEWAGSAVDLLMETDREISGDEFTAILQGKSPATGEPLGRNSQRSVHGFDLTFSAPKTVSLLYALGDARIADAARAAHDDAVRQALGYLERHACWSRQGKDGKDHVRGAGFVAAGFRHRTSRAGDPALHTHLVVANVTRRPDGSWASLDSRQLYRHAKTAGFLYQAALRAHLHASLGVPWEVPRNGLAEISGVPRSVIEHFSQRRAQIVERMTERGETSRQAASVAALETRPTKPPTASIDNLRSDWRARAAEHGFGAAELTEVLARREPFPSSSLEDARLAVDAVLPELTEQASTFDRRDVLRAWAERHRRGAEVTDLEQLTDRWLASDRAIALEPADRPYLPRKHSTPEMLELERRLVEESQSRQRTRTSVASADTRDEILDRRTDLSDEQRTMVRALTSSGDGVQVVRAAAGTGKTYALDAARDIWQRDGKSVLGCALSARAAVELREQTGIPTQTIASLQYELGRGHQLPDDGILIVDEAGMVGTRAIADLADHARLANAKLVLCGDDRQLPEIEAGGAMRGLAKRLGAIELRDVQRQQHGWDRDALRALRDGKVEAWADSYREHKRIVAATDATAIRARLVDDWHRATLAHPEEDNLMLAHRRADVADLNQRARERMHATGQLGDIELEAEGRAFAVGDRVVTTQNDRANQIVNGERGRITAVDPRTLAVHVRFDSGRTATLSSAYVTDGNLDHAYAMTAHRAQGATVDRAFILGSDDLYREWGYTALSRHRDEARYYVNLGQEAQLNLPGLEVSRERPADPVIAPLQQRRAKQLAMDSVRAQRGAAPTVTDAQRERARAIVEKDRSDPPQPSNEEKAAARALVARPERGGAIGPSDDQREAARRALLESGPVPMAPEPALEPDLDIGQDFGLDR